MTASNNKNITFIANYDKTTFFEVLADKLLESNVESYWIVINKMQHDKLVQKYGSEKVLLIYKSLLQNSFEIKEIGEFKLNELVYGDRSLKHQQNWAYDYLKVIQNPIYIFLKSNQISYVFGELTWAHELLTYRICSQTDVDAKFLNPDSIRIPSDRYAFFTKEFQCDLLEIPTSIKPFEKIKFSFREA